MNLDLKFGVVVDNDDPLKKSRIRVRLLPGMTSVPDSKLPWLEPLLSSGSVSDKSYKHEPLEVGSNVWCIFSDDTLLVGWYFTGVFSNESFDFSEISDDLSNIVEESFGDYKDLRFTRYSDGTIEFHNVSTGLHGTYHSSGSYTIFDSSGGIVSYSVSSIKVYNDNNSLELEDSAGISVNTGTGEIKFNGSSDSLVKYSDLSSILDLLIQNLDTRIHSDPLTGTTGTVMPTHIHLTFDPLFNIKKTNMEAVKVKTS